MAIPRWPFVVAIVAIALALGKIYINGRSFTEDVSMEGKVVVITGGNTGLGKPSAIRLAQLGAQVIIACRDEARGLAAVAEIKKASSSEKVTYVNLDLSSFASVERCAEELHKAVSKVDVLMNNAGVFALPKRELSVDGIEKQMAINQLGHFLFTNLLMDLVKNASASRIVTVSSHAHYWANLTVNEDILSVNNYSPLTAYANSKLANILFTRELNRRLEEQASSTGVTKKITVVAVHPGGVFTEGHRYLNIPAVVLALLDLPARYLFKSPTQGAQTQLFVSASSTVTPSLGGEYFVECAVADTSAQAKDAELAKFLWAESERLTGRKFVL